MEVSIKWSKVLPDFQEQWVDQYDQAEGFLICLLYGRWRGELVQDPVGASPGVYVTHAPIHDKPFYRLNLKLMDLVLLSL